jgi:hypothetical protein
MLSRLPLSLFLPARRHPASRVAAKVVYNEFIADRNHIHMNSTCWLTLTEFVKYLGREGKCKVEETEKGWFITLIRVSTAVARQPGASDSALLWQRSGCYALSSSWAGH